LSVIPKIVLIKVFAQKGYVILTVIKTNVQGAFATRMRTAIKLKITNNGALIKNATITHNASINNF
jgi:hypothetical protein